MVLCSEEFAATADRGRPLFPAARSATSWPPRRSPSPSRPARVRRLRPADRPANSAATLADALQRQGATVITGGTDNHLLTVDVARPYGLTGRQAETALREAGITLNRNGIPFDPNGSWYTSGLRLGTPAVTTPGMGADEMRRGRPSSTRSWNPPTVPGIPRRSTPSTSSSATRPAPRRLPSWTASPSTRGSRRSPSGTAAAPSTAMARIVRALTATARNGAGSHRDSVGGRRLGGGRGPVVVGVIWARTEAGGGPARPRWRRLRAGQDRAAVGEAVRTPPCCWRSSKAPTRLLGAA